MPAEKPKTLEEYRTWLSETHHVEVNKRTENHFDSVARKVHSDFQQSTFWGHIISSLPEWSEIYLIETGFQLLAVESPVLVTKCFDSFFLKTFRKNVLNNSVWPDPPAAGWLLPTNWFPRVNDLVRTLFVVKYLDGVEFLVKQIEAIAATDGLDFKADYEAREEGYYAAHAYVIDRFEIPGIDWDTELADITIELQVTTQLQEVIRKLLHKFYESRREVPTNTGVDKRKWQWEYRCDEFVPNYLGHILHYLEGMIMEIKDKHSEENKWNLK